MEEVSGVYTLCFVDVDEIKLVSWVRSALGAFEKQARPGLGYFKNHVRSSDRFLSRSFSL